MTQVENRNGKYPKMQNPGVPGVFEKTPVPKKHILLINKAALADPNGYDEKIMLYPEGVQPPTDEEDKQVLIETTYFAGK